MAVQRLRVRKHRCQLCHRHFTSWGRLQHHHAAEHRPRSMEDIARKVSGLPMGTRSGGP